MCDPLLFIYTDLTGIRAALLLLSCCACLYSLLRSCCLSCLLLFLYNPPVVFAWSATRHSAWSVALAVHDSADHCASVAAVAVGHGTVAEQVSREVKPSAVKLIKG
jgi:hypothetical protein